MLPNRHDLIISQGKTFKFWFRVVNPDTGTVRNLVADGYSTARMQIRDKPADQGGVIQLDLSTANGGIVLGNPPIDDGTGQLWSGYLYASATTTGRLRNWGRGGYDLEIVKDGNQDEILLVLTGYAVLEQEWTR